MDASALSKIFALDGPFTTLYLDSSSTAEDAAEQSPTDGVGALLRYAV